MDDSKLLYEGWFWVDEDEKWHYLYRTALGKTGHGLLHKSACKMWTPLGAVRQQLLPAPPEGAQRVCVKCARRAPRLQRAAEAERARLRAM